jgi:hypothetical protein
MLAPPLPFAKGFIAFSCTIQGGFDNPVPAVAQALAIFIVVVSYSCRAVADVYGSGGALRIAENGQSKQKQFHLPCFLGFVMEQVNGLVREKGTD